MGIYKFNKQDAIEFARSRGTRYHESGDELVFEKCPFCGEETVKNDNKNKFAINLKTGQYNCFRASCGARGNMITLSRYFNFELPGYADEYFNKRKQYVNFSKAPRPATTDPAIEYMKSRGIPEVICRKYELTTDSKNSDLLIFPFYDEYNSLQLVKYRNMKATKENGQTKEWTFKDQKNDLSCKPILFGMNHCDPKNDTLIMTEGQIDSLSLAAAGIENAVSVPFGCNGFTWVPYCWNFMHQFKKLIVFGDYERGQISLLSEMQNQFQWGIVSHVRYEDYKDCKDANDLLRKYGPEHLLECIKNAVSVESKNIIRLSTVMPRPISEMECIKTGIESLDKVLGGFYFGQLVILTGERGEGKSTLANQLALRAVDQSAKTLIYSGELPNGSLRDWVDHQAAGCRNMIERKNSYGDTIYDVEQKTADKIAKWYSDYLFIYQNQFLEDPDAEEEQTVMELIEEAVKQGIRFIIIDNLMTAMDDDVRVDLYRAQTKFVKQLVRIAKAWDILIILVAHQRKNQGTNRTADDVSGSANITNLADIVMTFGKVKDKENKPNSDREIRVQKNRLTGRLGDPIPIWFEAGSRRVNDCQAFGWAFSWEKNKDDDGFMDATKIPNPFEEVIFGDN